MVNMENNKKTVMVSASIALMAEEDVMRVVDHSVLEKIKADDPHPVFAMMSVGYEGESTGQLYADLNSGTKLSKWFKQLWPVKAVNQLVSLMKSNAYTPVFEKHDITSQNRIVVGNVVASTKKILKGVTHAVAVAYINNWGTRERVKRGDLNGCSLEAECLFREAENSYNYIVDEVTSFNGIALLNREENPPGFEDSNILAVVAAMSEKRKAVIMAEGDKTINLRDVQEYIKEHGLHADRLFSVQELTTLPAVVGAFESQFDEKIKAITEENKSLKEEIGPYRKMASQQKVAEYVRKSDLLKDEYKETVDYLIDTLNPDVSSTEEPQKIVDAAIKRQLEIMQKANFKLKSTDQKAGKEDGADDTDNADSNQEKGTDSNVVKDDMTVAKNNPLIPA